MSTKKVCREMGEKGQKTPKKHVFTTHCLFGEFIYTIYTDGI